MRIVKFVMRLVSVGLWTHTTWNLWVAAEVAMYGICQYSILNVVVCLIIGAEIEKRIWRWANGL